MFAMRLLADANVAFCSSCLLLVSFAANSVCLNGLKTGDYVAFAGCYNGSGQKDTYGALIQVGRTTGGSANSTHALSLASIRRGLLPSSLCAVRW